MGKRGSGRGEQARWVRTESDREAVRQGCWFDLAAAERVRQFCGLLRQSKGEWGGRPLHLQTWQWERVVAPLFGWKRADGSRRFRRAFVEIPKKNGKSTLASALALYLLMADREPGAEVYVAAADRGQAGIVFEEAANMAEASPFLAKRLEFVRSKKRVVYRATRSVLAALSCDARRKEGFNIHGLIADELHAWAGRELWNALQYGGAARRQPVSLVITTAGWDRDTICWELHQYALGILEGTVVDPWFLPVVYAAAADADWTAPATWRQANPSLGVTLREEELAEECARARSSPLAENCFRRYRLNEWTEQEVRWLPLHHWDAEQAPLPAEELAGLRCFGGLDLSSTIDLSALALLFPPQCGERRWRVLMRYWAPALIDAERERRNLQRYDLWFARGLIERTPGNVVDYERVRADLLELAGRYRLVQLGVDRWNAIQLTQQLAAEGLPVQLYGQGFRSMTAPCKELEKLVLSGQLWHGGHPVLRWNAANAVVETDAAGNVKLSKGLAVDKIDGLVALVMALGLALAHVDGASVYEGEGLLVL